MKLDELQSVQARERQTDQLQQLRSTFYEEAGEFIAQLREERDRAADRADDPFSSPEVSRLTDDINTAEQTVEAVYERRVGKIVKMASLAAADMPTEDGGLTDEERELFETMVDAIEKNRGHVLDIIAGDAPTDTDDDDQPPPGPDGTRSETTETSVDAADIMGGGDGQSEPPPAVESDTTARSETSPDLSDRPDEEAVSATGDDQQGGPANDTPVSADEPRAPGGEQSADGTTSADEPDDSEPTTRDDTSSVDRTTVRITDDVGEIFGVDEREYDLSADDVVTLPAANADPLVQRDAAEPLE